MENRKWKLGKRGEERPATVGGPYGKQILLLFFGGAGILAVEDGSGDGSND
jgi:hypothetical protein